MLARHHHDKQVQIIGRLGIRLASESALVRPLIDPRTCATYMLGYEGELEVRKESD